VSGPVRRGRRDTGRIWRGAVRRIKAITRPIPHPRLPQRSTGGIRNSLLADKRLELAGKRTFGPHDLERLARLLEGADDVVPVREAHARRSVGPKRFIALRHDMDHDVENSVRLAEWESQHGFRSTYYVLHGDWYWGGPFARRPSTFVLRALDRIASLGHEIGLHNNAITIALLTGDDPGAILDRDLSALRQHGFDIVGSVAHGDPLCRSVGYINNELFTECARPAMGAADRLLTYNNPALGGTRSIRIQPRSMAESGLTHEANNSGHTTTLSDTGGHWSVPFDQVDELIAGEGLFLQALIHPVWWALSGEVVKPWSTSASAINPDR